jgi:hypothetical protein
MKKIISTTLLVALALTMVFTLVSCGGLSGTYEGALFDLKFSGSKVTVIAGENELKGTYEIEEEDGNKTITFDFVDEDEATEDEKEVLELIDAILGQKLAFAEDGDTIKIGKIIPLTFKKK